MSAFWRFDNLERITGGTWLAEPTAGDQTATGLSHDTRTLSSGQVYLAVSGENHDGHDFVDQAFEAGAALAIVESPNPSIARLQLVVDNTVTALQDLASAFRDELARGGCRVIAVCGSNGKTTTRHLLHYVLTGCGLRGTQSPKSFNNHLGVPLTLLAADPSHDFVACEVGTNHPGEIASLGDIVWPDAAIVTSIGREHLEFFGDLEGVAREEASILPFVRRGGLAVTTPEAAALMMPHYDVAEGVTVLPVTGAPGVPAEFPLPGRHNRMNAALVAAVGRWMGIDDDRIAAAWAGVGPPPGRLREIALGQGVTLLDDTYNANPDSVRVALDTLAERLMGGSGRRVAVLGEMRELGDASAEAHAETATRAEQSADRVEFVGDAFGAEPWSDAWARQVVDRLEPGDTVLLKASRGVRLERLIPLIEKRFGPAHPVDER
ncbi:MAG: UDP-N-acetylmuramoyl-tripeptide--D-alanyl-D-alanine ligase [Planctomycetota bacterium]